MSVDLRTWYVILPLSIIVALTVVSCADPAAKDPSGVIPWSSRAPAPDSGFPAPPPEPTLPEPALPEPTGSLAGDDTNLGGNPPLSGGTNSNPGGNPPANGGTNTNPSGSPPSTGSTNTNPGGGTVSIAGPTLDNRYPEVWSSFQSSGQDKCTSITNGGDPDSDTPDAEVDIRITGIRIVDQSPPSPKVFRVFSPASDRECGDSSGLRSVGSCLDDPILSPYEQEGGAACRIGIVTDARPGTDYTAKLVYELEAVCTTTTLSPCDKISDSAPSPSAPVQVRWQYIESITACFVARPDGGGYYSEEVSTSPAGSRCPPRDGT